MFEQEQVKNREGTPYPYFGKEYVFDKPRHFYIDLYIRGYGGQLLDAVMRLLYPRLRDLEAATRIVENWPMKNPPRFTRYPDNQDRFEFIGYFLDFLAIPGPVSWSPRFQQYRVLAQANSDAEQNEVTKLVERFCSSHGGFQSSEIRTGTEILQGEKASRMVRYFLT